jgi:quercetin dioxygenase-like cupin family protein
MKLHNLEKDFIRGWVVGDFDLSIIRTKDFEFMVRDYKKGENEPKHVHKIADEITVIVSGKVKMNNIIYSKGDVIHLSPGDATDFECLEDATTAVIKTPSVIGDKYLV